MALLQWSGPWMQTERKKRQEVKGTEGLISNSFSFANAAEFDKLWKLYNLTPKTGQNKLQKERKVIRLHGRGKAQVCETDCHTDWDTLGVGGATRVYHLITPSIKPAQIKLALTLWKRSSRLTIMFLKLQLWSTWLSSYVHTMTNCYGMIVTNRTFKILNFIHIWTDVKLGCERKSHFLVFPHKPQLFCFGLFSHFWFCSLVFLFILP